MTSKDIAPRGLYSRSDIMVREDGVAIPPCVFCTTACHRRVTRKKDDGSSEILCPNVARRFGGMVDM